MTDTVDTITLRSLHSAAAQGPFRAEIDAQSRGRYDAHSITDDYGAVATGIDPKTAEYWVAVLADAPALFSAAEERDALRAENERLREALTAVDGIAWSVPCSESTESEALNKRLCDIRALTKAALAPEPTP